MVPLKFLRKRSSRFGATCWGITTHQANRADGLCKYCKGLPHPSAQFSLTSRYTLSSDTSFPYIFFLKISMAPLFFQYNFYFINLWFLDGVRVFPPVPGTVYKWRPLALGLFGLLLDFFTPNLLNMSCVDCQKVDVHSTRALLPSYPFAYTSIRLIGWTSFVHDP